MQATVLEVLNHKIDSMNGMEYRRYRFKLMRDNRIWTTDGFGQVNDREITNGDIIEDMQIVGHVSGAELCALFYKAKKLQESIPMNYVSEKRIWFPNKLGETISVDGNIGFIYGITNPFSYIPGYTWLIEWEKDDLGITTGKRLRQQLEVEGIYIEPKLMPSDEVEIEEYIPSLKGKAILWGIYFDKDTREYTYRFQYRGEYWKMVEYKTDRLLLMDRPVVQQVEVKQKVIEVKKPQQLDLFSLI